MPTAEMFEITRYTLQWSKQNSKWVICWRLTVRWIILNEVTFLYIRLLHFPLVTHVGPRPPRAAVHFAAMCITLINIVRCESEKKCSHILIVHRSGILMLFLRKSVRARGAATVLISHRGERLKRMASDRGGEMNAENVTQLSVLVIWSDCVSSANPSSAFSILYSAGGWRWQTRRPAAARISGRGRPVRASLMKMLMRK